MTAVIKPMSKSELTKIFLFAERNLLPRDWVMTDDEVLRVNESQRKLCVEDKGEGEASHEEIITEYWRVDHKTHRLINAGYVIMEGVALFAKEEDALEYLNARGGNFKTFEEVQNASDAGVFESCYYMNWL